MLLRPSDLGRGTIVAACEENKAYSSTERRSYNQTIEGCHSLHPQGDDGVDARGAQGGEGRGSQGDYRESGGGDRDGERVGGRDAIHAGGYDAGESHGRARAKRRAEGEQDDGFAEETGRRHTDDGERGAADAHHLAQGVSAAGEARQPVVVADDGVGGVALDAVVRFGEGSPAV
jgi:hypothetical protein